MKGAILALSLCLCGITAAQESPAPAAAPAEVSAAERDQQLLDSYAAQPTLENAARILGLASLDDENGTYRMGFCSQLIRQHSAHLNELLEKAGGGDSPTIRLHICTCCWLADTPESNKAAATILKYDPIIEAWSRIKPGTPKPDFTKLEELTSEPMEAMALDMAWGAYDATRRRDILSSFIRCGTRTAAPEKPLKLWMVTDEQRARAAKAPNGIDVVSMAAKWSVQSRAKADAAFAAEVQACLSTMPADVQGRWKEPLPDYPQNESEYTPNPKSNQP
ncbi:MAG: hypothetical protein MJ056_05570 [Akkermansia sp.]|nr:hypothetical protein [Akkermansia sp.]